MPTMISGLGGAAGYGEQSFKTTGGFTGNLDDGSRLVDLSSVFGSSGLNLYGTTYTSVYINTNGLLTFNSANPSYTPGALTSLGQPSIAPFWTDIDISKGGDIYWDLDPVKGKVTITWLNTRAYSATGTNSFQVVLTNEGGGNFGVDFIYQDIGFTNGYTGQATVGFSDGTTTQTLLPGSNNATSLANYGGTDFQTDDPVGIYSLDFAGGVTFSGNGIVDGTVGDDLIDVNYIGDPNGDRVDNNDATGYAGTSGQDDYIRGGLGNDTISSGLGNDQVYGGVGNDVINTGRGNDTAFGGTGNDSIDGSSGNDLLYGGAGNDSLFGGAATTGTTYTPSYSKVTANSTSLLGTNGRSNFSVNTVSDDGTVDTGNSGGISGYRLGRNASEVFTHTASTQVLGGQIRFNQINGDEVLSITLDGVATNLNTLISSGLATFDGAGVYSVNAAGNIVRVGSGGTSNTIGTLSITKPFTTISVGESGTTTGGSQGFFYELYANTNPADLLPEAGGNDTLFGGDGDDFLYGGDGDDSLSGGAGNATLFGGDGNDTLTGGAGADVLNGGAGTDTASYATSTAGVSVNLATGAASGGDATGDTLSSIENLTGSALNDTLTGDTGANVLDGGAGNDVLDGGAGNDTLFGGDGNDTLTGGAGNDTLTGGAGADQFRFDRTGGADQITDFDLALVDGKTVDQLDISELRTLSGNPVNWNDVTVSDDGNGNAVLTFPEGESVVLFGVSPQQATGKQNLAQMGVPCYAPGTMIDTPDGPRAVDSLRAGDMVTTFDHGPQPIRWTRSSNCPLENVDIDAKPVHIEVGALGRNLPLQDLIVSAQHRILIGGSGQLQEVFSSEGFAPAKSLTALPGIRHMKGKQEVTWVHFACDRHEVVFANGCLSESLLLGPMVVNGMNDSEREAMSAIFGHSSTSEGALNGPPARGCLTVGAVKSQVSKHLKEKAKLMANEIPIGEEDLKMEEHETKQKRAVEPLARAAVKVRDAASTGQVSA